MTELVEPQPGEQLSLFERERLDELEAVIERGLAMFVEVGMALLEIRDQRFYRETHGTFEEYLDDRWSMSRSRGYQLIDAARVTDLVSTIVDTSPANEAQARELVPLLDRPDELAEVMLELRAQHGDRLTAEKVRLAVSDRLAIEQKVGTFGQYGVKTSVEWYTPQLYVDAARDVLGGIDLDPASNTYANETVRAARFYDAETDGLSQPWRGRVFMNPPYGAACGLFVQKALDEHAAGHITAILLVNGYSFDSGWFRPLWDHLLCFTYGRINFYNPARVMNGGTTGSVFVYLGAEPERFTARFSEIGAVVTRWAR